MEEIEALLIPARGIASVAEALRDSGVWGLSNGKACCRNVGVSHVQRLLTAPGPAPQQKSHRARR
jgi:hypothetical protein